LGDPGLYRVIVRWIFRKWDVGITAESNWRRTGAGSGLL